MLDDFIICTAIEDGHDIFIRFPFIRSVEVRMTPTNLPYSEIRMCGLRDEYFYVMQSPEQIFEAISEKTIIGLNGDHGIVAR